MSLDVEPGIDGIREIVGVVGHINVTRAVVGEIALKRPLDTGAVVVLDVEIGTAACRGDVIVKIHIKHTGGLIGETIDNVIGAGDLQGIGTAGGLFRGDQGILRRARGVAPGSPVGVVLRTERLACRVGIEVVAVNDRLCLHIGHQAAKQTNKE